MKYAIIRNMGMAGTPIIEGVAKLIKLKKEGDPEYIVHFLDDNLFPGQNYIRSVSPGDIFNTLREVQAAARKEASVRE